VRDMLLNRFSSDSKKTPRHIHVKPYSVHNPNTYSPSANIALIIYLHQFLHMQTIAS
jgi:hypothetical protein